MHNEQLEIEILRFSSQAEKTRFSFRIFSRLERISLSFNIKLRDIISTPNTFRDTETYSESLQDCFALKVGRMAGLGTYIEIGSGDPLVGSNSYLLEKNQWRGFSIELDSNLADKFDSTRKNPVFCADGTNFEYFDKINELQFGDNIGYLQVDIDPSVQSLLALLAVPFNSHKFACITFEHDAYRSSTKIRNLQRDYLLGFGYVLIASNVKVNRLFVYEDWWVHPELVNVNELDCFRSRRKHPTKMNWGSPLSH